MVLADLYTAISGIGYLIVRTAGDLPGRQDVRADRDARPARRHADGAAARRSKQRVAPWTAAVATRLTTSDSIGERSDEMRMPASVERRSRFCAPSIVRSPMRGWRGAAAAADLHDHAQDQCRRLGRAAERRAHVALCGQGARPLRQALHRRQHHPVRRRPVADLDRGGCAGHGDRSASATSRSAAA